MAALTPATGTLIFDLVFWAVWLALAVWVGRCARRRGDSFPLWTVLAVITSPVLMAIVVSFLHPRNKVQLSSTVPVLASQRSQQARMIILSFGVAVIAVAGVLWLVSSLSSNLSGVSSHDWARDFELIWVFESAVVIAAACCSYWSPRSATALLLPAIVFRIISLGQFYVPKSGYSGHATAFTLLSLIGLILASLGFILLALVARPFWALTRSSLIVTMVVFVVAIGWSVAAALPGVHDYLRAPAGRHWKANGLSVFEYNCCAVTSVSLTLGQKITTWAQVVAAPLLVLVSGLRAGKTVQGVGWISAGGVMAAIGLSILPGLGPFSPYNLGEYATEWILPAGVFVIVGGAIVFLIGVTTAFWTSAGRIPASPVREQYDGTAATWEGAPVSDPTF